MFNNGGHRFVSCHVVQQGPFSSNPSSNGLPFQAKTIADGAHPPSVLAKKNTKTKKKKVRFVSDGRDGQTNESEGPLHFLYQMFDMKHRPTAGGWLEDAATPAPTPLISTEPLRCLVLDNDETTGDYQLGSLLFAMYRSLCPDGNPPPHQYFIAEYLVKLRGARPGTKELLKMAHGLQQKGQLDHIVLFTAASNATGWVTFLAECLADYAEIPRKAISRVVAAEDCPPRVTPGGGRLSPYAVGSNGQGAGGPRIVKDLRLICTDASNVVIVDDKPQFVRGTTATAGGGGGGGVNGSCIHVGEYRVPSMDIGHLVEAMPLSEARKVIARHALKEDAEKYPRINAAIHRHANMELYSVIKKVMSIYA